MRSDQLSYTPSRTIIITAYRHFFKRTTGQGAGMPPHWCVRSPSLLLNSKSEIRKFEIPAPYHLAGAGSTCADFRRLCRASALPGTPMMMLSRLKALRLSQSPMPLPWLSGVTLLIA